MSTYGGKLIAQVLKAHGVRFLFTLCGGHISPILKGAKDLGIRIVDVRHEATAVFAADAVARLTGVPGVAAVTAGPGATNTITAVKNAQLAQSPLVLIGGAAATALKGRGALQDIDQMALMRPHVKWAHPVTRVRDLVPAMIKAFHVASSGIPGPVFIECPVDLLYAEEVVREWFSDSMPRGDTLGEKAVRAYLGRHVNRLFSGLQPDSLPSPLQITPPSPSSAVVKRCAKRIFACNKPVLVVGSQALVTAENVHNVAGAVERMGMPVYLSGMARGLLGAAHPLHRRHQRRKALRGADLVILAGVPSDFRLDYGRTIRRSACLISANRSRTDLHRNRRPNIGARCDAGLFLQALADELETGTRSNWEAWQNELLERDEHRETEIQ
ncbi:MAG: thiamine pyrophosphate-binding protein, partial [Gammaproteobacteria bacterium]|nr:thiamine pyrophosphate-binding protein [Gammaproteobacteria bacterium]